MLCAEPTLAEQLCSLLSSHLRGPPVSPFSRLSSVGFARRPLHNVFDLHKCIQVCNLAPHVFLCILLLT